jgi:serine/threonine protein kinase
MGEVYRAYDEHSREQVSIKTLRGEYAVQPEFVKRLMHEMRLARRIQHPNICRVFDVQRATGPIGSMMIFLIMEFLEGETLESRIRRGPLPLDQATRIAVQLIDGLQAAHEAGIIHRDLKSANVMLVPAPGGERAVITDFGLARELRHNPGDSRSLFGTGAIIGTAAYMAPEQLQGKSITTAADIHALGVILFELVTGRHPFEGETPLAIALRRLSNSAPSPSELVKGLDRDWETATLACLESDPARRPSTPLSVRAILEGTGPRRPLVPRRGLLWTAGGVVLAASLAGVFWRQPQPRNAQAEHHFKLGEEFVRRRSADDLTNAVTEYEQAIQLDRNYADAWAGLADAWAAIANFSLGNSDVSLTKARRAAETAMRLKPTSARSVGILGYCISIECSDTD